MNLSNALRLSLAGLLVLASAAAPSTARAADQAHKIKVLLVTGDDVTPPHDWPEVSQALKEILAASGRFEVRVCEDAGVLDSGAALGRYDLVLLDLYNAKTPTLSAAAKENLLSFVSNGKGFSLIHLSSASFKEWPEYRKLCGRVWVMGSSGHGPRGVFKARIAKKDDPITQGLEDFEADDELYSKLQGDAPITTLVEADSDWSKKTEPLAFTLSYGQGRVFHTTLGHDGKALKNASVQKLLVRGCEWAATGKVQ
jgi:uncharacterized protein